ncbi:cyanophycinase [Limibacter armeniacum]|uniref:cyanophycinase n=1 Tax=Limibacter armeniacum TaxID=466084 RepID=UPI002FE65A32
MKLNKLCLWSATIAMAFLMGCDATPEETSTEDSNNRKGSGRGPTVYTTGNSSDIVTTPSAGIALMGGADSYTTAEDAAFDFLTQKANGGDFVVLRSSSSDGYNNYIYSDVGGVNSVRTIVVDSRSDADHTTTIDLVNKAEGIFIAGGDQDDYVSFWKDSQLETAINNAVTQRNVPIGGSSAGLAVLGAYYYAASNGTVYSDEALDDPYNNYMAGLGDGFLAVPYMTGVVTDSHYNERDRQGRHFTFMARFFKDFGASGVKGVGVDEATAVLVESNGSAKVYGSGKAYFLKSNGQGPETCTSNTPLSWNRNGNAVSAYIISGTSNGNGNFSFTTWSGSGGVSESWSANSGNFSRN